MPKHLYAPIYRPAAFAGLPEGWEYVESPPALAHKLRHLPMSTYVHGVIAYGRALSVAEARRLGLEYVGERD
jgi:hypothetical protein